MCPALSISESRYRSRRLDLLSGAAGGSTTALGAGSGGIVASDPRCSSSAMGYDVAQKLVVRRVNNVRASRGAVGVLGPDGVGREMHRHAVGATRARSGAAKRAAERALMLERGLGTPCLEGCCGDGRVAESKSREERRASRVLGGVTSAALGRRMRCYVKLAWPPGPASSSWSRRRC